LQGARPKRFKIVSDFFALSGGQLLSKVIGFAAFAYLARTLSPASYGILEYAIGMAAFFALVIEGGLGPIGVRAVSQTPDRVKALSALIPSTKFCIAVGAIPLMCLVPILTGQDMVTQYLVGLFALSLLVTPWNQEWLLQGLEMMNAAALAQVVRMLVFAIGVVLFVQSSEDLLNVGWVEVVAVSTLIAYYLFVQRWRIAKIRLRFRLSELRQLVRQSFSVGASNIVGSLIHFAPLFLIASMVGGEATGWFAASHRVVVSLLTFSWIYHINLYPTIARRAIESSDDLSLLVRSSFRVSAWTGILVGLLLTLLASPLLTLIFGSAFSAAGPTFGILIWVLPVTLLSGHARWSLIAYGHQRYVLLSQLAGAVAAVAFGSALIPSLHSFGAGIAALMASLVVWGVAHTFALKHIARLPSLSMVWLPLVVAVVCAVVTTTADMNLWLAAGAAGAAYVITAPLVDRQLLPDLGRLVHAKADLSS